MRKYQCVELNLVKESWLLGSFVPGSLTDVGNSREPGVRLGDVDWLMATSAQSVFIVDKPITDGSWCVAELPTSGWHGYKLVSFQPCSRSLSATSDGTPLVQGLRRVVMPRTGTMPVSGFKGSADDNFTESLCVVCLRGCRPPSLPSDAVSHSSLVPSAGDRCLDGELLTVGW